MEAALSKKDMEIEHLIAKVQSTIMEYEERLDLKEHKLAEISTKLAEGLLSILNYPLTLNRKSKAKAGAFTSDYRPWFHQLARKEISSKGSRLAPRNRQYSSKIGRKDAKIMQAIGDLEDLQRKSFQPRMLRLAEIEKGMSHQLELIAVSEEKIEVLE